MISPKTPLETVRRLGLVLVVAGVAAVLGGGSTSEATELVLKDGRLLRGKFGLVSGLAEQPVPPGQGKLQPIAFVDDDLRRTFISKRLVQDILQEEESRVEKFSIFQRIPGTGTQIYSVGRIVSAAPFDRFGRRLLTFAGPKGTIDLVQGITTLTPQWMKVEGVTHSWDMRLSTANFPSPMLMEILVSQVGAEDIEYQKKMVRFFIQMQRYEEAMGLLDRLIDSNEKNPETKKQLESSRRQLRQLAATRLLEELKRRQTVGQHALSRAMLERFPADEVAGEILQEIRELVEQYRESDSRGKAILKKYLALVEKNSNPAAQEKLRSIGDEMKAELNRDTLNRLAAFRLAMGDEKMLPGDRLALAVNGWLLGSDAASTNLSNALSAYTVRRLVREYLLETDSIKRAALLEELRSQEAASPKVVSLILAQMKPPMASEPVEGRPGYFALETYGMTKEQPVKYYVQLPPEYDPYRRYPAIVTLHDRNGSAENQLDWWAGSADGKGGRRGQAGRWGYIVISPQWAGANQYGYRYSASEHAAVLNAIRDASRRFSIDTDRVFLSGHGTGGDAAWDIGLAHPDLWAGVLPFLARADRYINFYWENAELVPTYFVGGEKDNRWLVANAPTLDRYLNRGYDATVVEFLGRGYDPLHDETLRAFEWMSHFQRNFYPTEFTGVSMRPWDNYFYWAEVDGLPSRSVVEPESWPPARGQIPMKTEGQIIAANNSIRIKTGASRVMVWVSPQMVNFDQKVPIFVNGRAINNKDPYVKPDLKIMLEDVRTRCDRLHPFWAKWETETGRRR